MKMSYFIKSIVAAAIAASLLIAGDASAQGRGRGEGRGGGGGGGGGQSFSRGDGGGSSRSFSRGDGGSSRSFSGSSRSFSRGDGGSSRSFSRGDAGTSRSFSRGDSGASRSFSRGDIESSQRTFSDQSRSRTYQAMRPSREGSSQFDRSLRTDQGERSTIGRSSDQFRSGQFSDQSGRGTRQYRGGRASEDQVRDFLGIERGAQRDRSDVARRRDEFRRGDVGDRDLSDRVREGEPSRDFARDRDVTRDRQRDIAGRDRTDITRDGDYQRWREGARSRDGDFDDRDWSGRWRDGERFSSANRIRESWRNRDWDDNDFPFAGRWWDDDDHWRGDHWNWWGRYAWRHNHPWYWWTWATVPRLTSWVAFGWPRPYYWDYGPGEYIYYDDGIVYVNGRWYAPGPVFYDRTVRIVESAPELTPEEAAELEWLPLGVFAVAEDGSADAFVLVQLAVTQDGVVSGTAYDQRSGAAFPVQGMVEKETQRAVWSYNDARNRRVVMETSIFNLTQPEATGLVHYGPNDMRVVELVRLEQPDANTATTGTAELPAP